MNLRRRVAVAAFIAGECLVSQAYGRSIDIRDCPLDTITFVDPWAGGAFSVKRVGTAYSYDCPQGVEPPAETCLGPYGDLVLEGEYVSFENAPPEAYLAVWSVIKGAPCCDWKVSTPGEVDLDPTGGFEWLDPEDAPMLRDMPFLSIESEYGNDFGNPVYAARCTLR